MRGHFHGTCKSEAWNRQPATSIPETFSLLRQATAMQHESIRTLNITPQSYATNGFCIGCLMSCVGVLMIYVVVRIMCVGFIMMCGGVIMVCAGVGLLHIGARMMYVGSIVLVIDARMCSVRVIMM